MNGGEEWLVAELRKARIVCSYVDYRTVEKGDHHLYNAIALPLKLHHAPYPAHTGRGPKTMLPFLDDLIGLSSDAPGVAIFVDGADLLLADNSRLMFDLIEAFLIQVEDWMKKDKPCHLFFLMEPNEALKSALALAMGVPAGTSA